MAGIADKQLSDRMELIRKSGLFDAGEYPFRTLAAMSNQDPIQHYLSYGEPRGARPSSSFDPAYYAGKYGITGDSPLLHYILSGRRRGWSPLPLSASYSYEESGFRPGFKRVVLLVHEGSLSGAPVLGWNIAAKLKDDLDVIVLLARGGALQQAFLKIAAACVHPMGDMRHPFSFAPIDADFLAREILTRFSPQAVLCNSIDNAPLAEAFGKRGIACVTLVHEFAEAYEPQQIRGAFAYSSHVVFPANIVRDSALRAFPALASRRVSIMPQGQSDIPIPPARPAAPLGREAEEEPMIVMGCGNMELRKGIDIFIATAATLRRMTPRRRVKFIWIGVDQTKRSHELMLLNHQLRESGLDGMVELLPATPAFKQYLSHCSVFFLPSRLDPLPNVAIDAMMEGKPVICFEGASGLPEYLASDDMLKTCYVPYLDAAAAAQAIARLIDDPRLLAAMGERARQQAQRTFRMADYVASLRALLDEAERLVAPLTEGRSGAPPQDSDILSALDTGKLPRFDA